MKRCTHLIIVAMLVCCSSKKGAIFNKAYMTTETVHYKIELVDCQEKKGEIVQKEIIKYNKAGDILEAAYSYTGISFDGGNVFQYDKKGRKALTYSIKQDGRVFQQENIHYNETNRTAERFISLPKSEARKIGINKYDDHENLLEEIEYYKDGSEYLKRNSNYDLNGNITDIAVWVDGRFRYKEIFQYNNKDILNEYSLFNEKGYLLEHKTYEYESFDSKGNWLVRRDTWKGTPRVIIERTIEYH